MASSPVSKKSSVSKKLSVHPPFEKMIAMAIQQTSERGGASRQAIKKYISSHFKVDESKLSTQLNLALRRGSDKGIFNMPKGPSGSIKVKKEAKKMKKPIKRTTVTKKKSVTDTGAGRSKAEPTTAATTFKAPRPATTISTSPAKKVAAAAKKKMTSATMKKLKPASAGPARKLIASTKPSVKKMIKTKTPKSPPKKKTGSITKKVTSRKPTSSKSA
jgi:histone H1/5